MVHGAKEHEATAPGHRLDPCPGVIGTFSVGSKRLEHGGVELAELPLEVSRDLAKLLLGLYSNVGCREG